MNGSTANLHDAPDWNRLIAPKIENALQNKIGVQAGRPEGRRIAGFQRQGNQCPCVKRAMVIGIAWQHEMMK